MKFKTAYLYAINRGQGLRNCVICGKELAFNQRKFCCKEHAEEYMRIPTEEKDREIIALLETGHYTLAQIGTRYNLSRERIRQIYHRATGHGYIKHIQTYWAIRKERKEKIKLLRDNSLKFNCNACQKPVLYKDGFHLSKLCRKCSDLFKKDGRDVYVTNICPVCKISFHPYRSMRAPSSRVTGTYCSMKCYGLSGAKRGNTQKYSDELLIDNLKEFFAINKRIPKYRDFDGNSPCSATIMKRFNGWKNALKKAGLIK